ncbi:hypothetical protein T4C_4210 [Trichinella pseudospiralis]|uniref:Uncharacterized protein n=1 Tax=Trichinella pseudospiralis TaxID=6337 RepID=A0A0V1JUZ4_TRIPS|nr:hypothetical protein T4C_4210 [Trichinella pseudospiralis]
MSNVPILTLIVHFEFKDDTIFLCTTFAVHPAQIVVNDSSHDRIFDHSPGQLGDRYPVTRAEQTKIDKPEWAGSVTNFKESPLRTTKASLAGFSCLLKKQFPLINVTKLASSMLCLISD